jgi:uncharacterized protein YdeI (YjbR/CyaY-like superfamily)
LADKPERYFPTRAELRRWLEAHGAREAGFWLVRDTGPDSELTHNDVLEECLAFGWIDSSVRKAEVPNRTRIWVSPRNPKSNWSAYNKAKVESLVERGLMAPSGLAAVAGAKESGTWDALNAVDQLEVPEDLARALAGFPGAAENFEAFSRSVRRGILEWILNAKRPETRAERVQRTAAEAAKNRPVALWARTKPSVLDEGRKGSD